MKGFSELNLEELAGRLSPILNPNITRRLMELHDLTRWIPVSERMPTEGERILMMMQTGLFAVGYVLNGECIIDMGTRFPAYYGYTVTHWQRITPPEAL